MFLVHSFDFLCPYVAKDTCTDIIRIYSFFTAIQEQSIMISRDVLVGFSLTLIEMASFIQCFSLSTRIPVNSAYLVEPEKKFTLDVKVYHLNNYRWTKNGRPLPVQKCNEGYIDGKIYTCEGNPDLIFQNISRKDNGKYILEYTSGSTSTKVHSFEILVAEKYILYIDCKDTTVLEGADITCICTASSDKPSAEIGWVRGTRYLREKKLSKVLVLEHLSRNQSGMYTCFSKMYATTYFASFNLNVLRKEPAPKEPAPKEPGPKEPVPKEPVPKHDKVKIRYFKVSTVNDSKISLHCKAKGIPEPSFTILRNGIAVTYEASYTFDVEKGLAKYECLARNRISFDKRSLYLSSVLLAKTRSGEEKDEFELFIVGACSFLAGIFFMAIFTCACKKLRKKKDHCNASDYVDVLPPNARERHGENNQMRLHRMSGSPRNDGYELPVLGNGRDNVYYNDTRYQDLSEFRERDAERYQHLCLADS